jgi:hypothetical protein
MNVRLTLNLNKDIVERAKGYAKDKNQSVSALVRNYFVFLSEDKKPGDIQISPRVKELTGIIKLDDDFDLKKERGAHILRKY